MSDDQVPAEVDLGHKVAMPMVGFGTWRLRGSAAYEPVRYALEVGYRHLDTATMYRNEAEVGRAIRDSGVDRADVFITTKLPPGQADRAQATIDASLRDLGTDHVDLWLIHWPPRGSASPRLWEQFIGARDAGLTRAIGVSNYSPAQIDELIRTSGEAPAVNQIPWSIPQYDPGLLAAHRDRGVRVEGYSSLKGTNLRDAAICRDRRAAPGRARSGRAALAPPARHRGHPEILPPRADRRQLRAVGLHAGRGRDGPAGRAVAALTRAARDSMSAAAVRPAAPVHACDQVAVSLAGCADGWWVGRSWVFRSWSEMNGPPPASWTCALEVTSLGTAELFCTPVRKDAVSADEYRAR